MASLPESMVSYASSTISSSSSECGDRTPSYTRMFPFTLYQHKVKFEPPLDYDVSKYKILVEYAELSPCIFNGKILLMTRAIPSKNRVGIYQDPQNPKKVITWNITFIGKVNRHKPMYRLFNQLIFTPGLNMKVFNLENQSTKTCRYEYEKRFNAFSIIPLHQNYKTTIRFSKFMNEIIYCSEFADPSSPKQKHYDFAADPTYCYNAKEYLIHLFEFYKDAKGKDEAIAKLEKRDVLAPYSGKVYKIGQVEFASSPKAVITDRNNRQREINLLAHYKSKYGIEIPPEDQTQIMLVAFPTPNEDINMNGKFGNFLLIPSLCYILKEWQGESYNYD